MMAQGKGGGGGMAVYKIIHSELFSKVNLAITIYSLKPRPSLHSQKKEIKEPRWSAAGVRGYM